jgi:peptide/nickel transport system substrate-binding protein
VHPVNNTTWRFTLRKGVTFHDGTPFNADSVVFTLRRVQSNSKLIKSFVYQDIESVEKDGDYAVTVTSKRPFGSLPAHLTMLGMLPPSAGKNETFQEAHGTRPLPLRLVDSR